MLGQSVMAFVLGVLMLDFAVQAVHVTNQTVLLAGRGEMASRLIAAYMCCYSLGSGVQPGHGHQRGGPGLLAVAATRKGGRSRPAVFRSELVA